MSAMLLALAACYTTTLERASDSEQRQLLDDLQLPALARDGAISRGEIEDRLGAPSAIYGSERITIYAVRKLRGRFEIARAFPPASWQGPDYSLVLVFGSDDRVERWSLVDRNHW